MLPRVSEFPTNELGADVRRALATMQIAAPLEQARQHFLQTVARLAPHVLRDLATHGDTFDDDDEAVATWARGWSGMDAAWVRIVARHTLTLWRAAPALRGRQWDANQHDRGELLPSRGRLSKRPAEWLVRADHFEWLVSHHVLGRAFAEITMPAETSRKAAHALARRLGLPASTAK